MLKKSSSFLLFNEEIQREQWQHLLGSSLYATPFQGPDWFDFQRNLNDPAQIPFALAVQNEKAVLQALISGMILQEPGWKWALTRRAIITGGVLLRNTIADGEEVVAALFNGLNGYLKDKGIIYGEIRNLHDYSLIKGIIEKLGWSYHSHLNFHVDCHDRNIMWQRMSSGRRRDIKYGEKRGAKIRLASTTVDVEKWYEILDVLYREKVKTPLPSLVYFKDLFSCLNTRLVLVEYRERIIGGLLGIVLPGHVFCDMFCCGLDDEYKAERIYPSILATWGAMELAHTEGIPRFDFMGAGKPGVPYGVRDFKEKFGGELVEHGRFVKIFSSVRYNIGKLAVIVKKRLM